MTCDRIRRSNMGPYLDVLGSMDSDEAWTWSLVPRGTLGHVTRTLWTWPTALDGCPASCGSVFDQDPQSLVILEGLASF